jgi:ABC-type branched-subunit amino acid transport system substrate-binding protein
MRHGERGVGWRRVAVAGTILAALLAGRPGPGEASHAIRIGIAGPMTGGDAKMGRDFERVGRFVRAERNGQVAGHRIEYVVEDDRADSTEAVAVARRLVKAGVRAVIGHYNSSCSIPASEIYNEAGIVQITPTSSNPKLTERGFPMLYRLYARDDQQGTFVASYLAHEVKAPRIAIVHDDTTYGRDLAEEIRSALARIGPQPVLFEAITRGETNFSSVVAKLKTASPDYTYFAGYYAEGGLLVRQFRDLGVPGIFFASDANQDQLFLDKAERAAEGVIVSSAPLPEQVPAAARFLSKYVAKHGPYPGPFVHYDYDAFNLLFLAMERAGKAIDNPKAVNAQLRKIKGFPGASGRLSFDEKGDVPGRERDFIVLIVKDGRFAPYWAPRP